MTKWHRALGQQNSLTRPVSAKTRTIPGKPAGVGHPRHTVGLDQSGPRGIKDKAITQISEPDTLVKLLCR